MQLEIKYSSSTYSLLCFRHAVQEAMRGENVESYLAEQELNEAVIEICRIQAERLIDIGTVGLMVCSGTVADNLGNFPPTEVAYSGESGVNGVANLRNYLFYWKK